MQHPQHHSSPPTHKSLPVHAVPCPAMMQAGGMHHAGKQLPPVTQMGLVAIYAAMKTASRLATTHQRRAIQRRCWQHQQPVNGRYNRDYLQNDTWTVYAIVPLHAFLFMYVLAIVAENGYTQLLCGYPAGSSHTCVQKGQAWWVELSKMAQQTCQGVFACSPVLQARFLVFQQPSPAQTR